MSDSRKSPLLLGSSSQSARPELGTLRPLAPKLPAIALRPLLAKSSTSPAQNAPTPRRGPSLCLICYRPACQLLTHRALGASLRSGDAIVPNNHYNTSPIKDPVFAASYAYTLARQYVDKDIAASKVDPFYDLPVKPDFNTPVMHRLSHQCKFGVPNLTLLLIY
jgi:hypothetical protein